jgi:hypothetical protein
MSKCPCQDRLNRITRFCPAERAASASSITPLIACAGSGPGTIPWVDANSVAASKMAFCVYAAASMWPSRTRSDSDGESPWYRRPPACTGAGTNPCPSVYIGTIGAIFAVSPLS